MFFRRDKVSLLAPCRSGGGLVRIQRRQREVMQRAGNASPGLALKRKREGISQPGEVNQPKEALENSRMGCLIADRPRLVARKTHLRDEGWVARESKSDGEKPAVRITNNPALQWQHNSLLRCQCVSPSTQHPYCLTPKEWLDSI
jgi:hypothetical protein